jgi:outer membrane assembly lipoprotein YfiO
MPARLSHAAILAVTLALLAAAEAAMGAEMWMPETGEIRLEDLPRDSVEARRLHALALIGAGQWSGGVEELRQLLEVEPNAPWAAEARFTIARGLIAAGRPRQGFDELTRLKVEFPGSPYAALVRRFQQTAARVQSMRDADSGAELYDLLIDTADNPDEAARVERDKGDALFRAGRYLDAEACYLELILLFPQSELCAYASYRTAECEWQMSQWLGLGLERLESAEREFEHFTQSYPTDAQVDDARERVTEVRAARASFNWEIARFYIDAEKKPWAAIVYLEHVIREFPDTPEAGWAAAELKRTRAGLKAPLRGEAKELPLPGVATSGEEP